MVCQTVCICTHEKFHGSIIPIFEATFKEVSQTTVYTCCRVLDSCTQYETSAPASSPAFASAPAPAPNPTPAPAPAPAYKKF